MPPPFARTYGPARLRRALILLTILTLPVVVGVSGLIYCYLKFSVMIDRKLQGERWMIPSRLYARPLLLKPGLPMTVDRLVRTLGNLRYDETNDVPREPGQF